ncbi:hypothetical protein FH965_21420 [Streptomyces spectabilis]|uniref:Uncharacterized protein n=1 Tax=Streptomyces spectabilis TaxID=68270 RepID=A0A516RAZ9_STRST|nr:hypothetical protein FH965_21420 [Streptomyces spectabilis]
MPKRRPARRALPPTRTPHLAPRPPRRLPGPPRLLPGPPRLLPGPPRLRLGPVPPPPETLTPADCARL